MGVLTRKLRLDGDRQTELIVVLCLLAGLFALGYGVHQRFASEEIAGAPLCRENPDRDCIREVAGQIAATRSWITTDSEGDTHRHYSVSFRGETSSYEAEVGGGEYRAIPEGAAVTARVYDGKLVELAVGTKTYRTHEHPGEGLWTWFAVGAFFTLIGGVALKKKLDARRR